MSTLWSTWLPVAISVLSLALGIWNFIEQKLTKQLDVLESRWRHYLDRLDTIKTEWSESSDDTGSATVAMLVATAFPEQCSLHEMYQQIRRYAEGNSQTLETPPALYDTFRALAKLYARIPKKRREFFDASLPPHTSTRHVGRVLIQALRHNDAETIRFLINSRLLNRFTLPIIGHKLEILRQACLRSTKHR